MYKRFVALSHTTEDDGRGRVVTSRRSIDQRGVEPLKGNKDDIDQVYFRADIVYMCQRRFGRERTTSVRSVSLIGKPGN